MNRSFSQKLEPQLKTHMKTVYSCAALSKLVACAGSYLHFMGLLTGGFLSSFVAVGFLIALMSTPDDGKNTITRLGYFLSFTFLCGLGLGPLVDIVIAIEPSVHPTAFFSISLSFACFTLASMLSNQRQYILVGGTLMSFLSTMMVVNFLNISYAIQMYIGISMLCAFILHNNQIMMEKHRNGDTDYIWHSACLFLDVIVVFVYLWDILTDKESNKKKE